MVNMAPTINVTQRVHEIVPEAPVFHKSRGDVVDAIGDAFTTMGSLAQMRGQLEEQEATQRRASQKEQLESMKTVEGNNLARETQRLVAYQEQTGDTAGFDNRMRRLRDKYLARGILGANDVSTISGNFDYGYLKQGEASRERFSKANDDALIADINEMRARYPSLKAQPLKTGLKMYNDINNSFDFAISLNHKLGQLDPNKYPEEYARLEEQRDQFWSTNIQAQTLLAISNDLSSDTNFFKDPAQVEALKQQYVEQLVRNQVSRPDAIVTVEQAMKMAGAFDVYEDKKQIIKLSNEDKKLITEYRMNNVISNVYESNEEILVKTAIMNSVNPEIFKELAVTGQGRKFVTDFTADWVKAIKDGATPSMTFSNKGQATQITSAVLRQPNTKASLKGTMVTALANDINSGIDLLELSPQDRSVVVRNSQGLIASLGDTYVDSLATNLEHSEDINEQNLGHEVVKAKKRHQNIVTAGAWLASPGQGGQGVRYLQEMGVASGLRYTDDGKLVYVKGQGALENLIGVDKALSQVNSNLPKVKEEDLPTFWDSIGVKRLGIDEEPAYFGEGATQDEFIKVSKSDKKPSFSMPTFEVRRTGESTARDLDLNELDKHMQQQQSPRGFAEYGESYQLSNPHLSEGSEKQYQQELKMLQAENDAMNNGYEPFDTEKYMRNSSRIAAIHKKTSAEPVVEGNIDVFNRKVLYNEDGTISTEQSISIGEDELEVLIPTVIDGKKVSNEEAIEHYRKTGEHLGKFGSIEEANNYAQRLHEQQEQMYRNISD